MSLKQWYLILLALVFVSCTGLTLKSQAATPADLQRKAAEAQVRESRKRADQWRRLQRAMEDAIARKSAFEAEWAAECPSKRLEPKANLEPGCMEVPTPLPAPPPASPAAAPPAPPASNPVAAPVATPAAEPAKPDIP